MNFAFWASLALSRISTGWQLARATPSSWKSGKAPIPISRWRKRQKRNLQLCNRSCRYLAATLRFLRRPDQHFADERLRCLRRQHTDHVGNVVGFKHLVRVLAVVPALACVHRARANDRDANILRPQFLGDGVAQPVQSPLRSGVGGAIW